MNRRQAITAMAGVVTIAAATGAEAQTGFLAYSGGSEYVVFQPTPVPPEERKRQYAICKERGHVAGQNQITNAIYYDPSQPQFDTCKFCGTSFRWVTTMEETNQPEGAQ